MKKLLLLIFPIVLALSRVMMGRHFLGDVAGGLFLGVFEAEFVFFVLTPQMMNFFIALLSKFVIL